MKSLRSTIEALEARIAPATVVHTLLTNGTLKISPLGTTTAASFGLFQVDVDSFTLLDSGSLAVQIDGVKNIQVVLTDLVDTVDFGFNGSGFRGDLSVKSGQGADSIDFLGGGANSVDVTLTSSGASLVTVAGGLGLLGDVRFTSVEGAFVNNGGIGHLTVTGAATVISNGSVLGNTRVTGPDSGLTMTATGLFNGDLVVKGGTGLDKLTLSGRTDGKVTFAAGEGGSQFVGDTNFFVGGRLTVTGGTAIDTVSIGLTALDPFTTTLGSAVFSLGDGNNSVSVFGNGRVAGLLRVSGLLGNDTVSLASSSGVLSVGGVVQLALGDGFNGIQSNGAILNGGINYSGGKDGDTVQLQSTDVLAAAKFSLGDGGSTVNVIGSTLDSGIYVKSGVGADNVTFGGATLLGKATLNLGDGTNNVNVTSSQLRSGFDYRGGTGQDIVILDASSQFFGTGSVKAGNGSNVLDARTLGGFSAFTFTGGVDADLLLLGAPGGQIVNFKATLGDGTDTANVSTTIFRSLRIDAGVGGDTLNRIAAATAGVFIGFETTNVIP